MKLLLIKKLGFVLLALLFTQGVAYGLTPEEELGRLKNSLAGEIENIEINQCVVSLTPLFDVEVLEFLRFLETNYQNKSANSSLNNIAIARFATLKNNLNGHFVKLTPNMEFDAGNLTRDEVFSYGQCRQLTDSYIQMAKEMMINHIKSTTAQKKSTVMVEKYKAINDGLTKMHLDFSRTYAMLNTFKDKLPGFLRQCIMN